MRIKYLRIKNFLSHKDTHLSFSDNEIVCVVGDNGSGKSSIFKALCYALFGKVPSMAKSPETSLINCHTLGQLLVEVQITHRGHTKTIKRGRMRDNTPVLEFEGHNGNKTTQDTQIKEWLGLTYDDFLGLYYFTQSDIHQFLLGNKADYFSRWTSSLERWQEYEGIVKEEITSLKKEITELEYKRRNNQAKVDNLDYILSELNRLTILQQDIQVKIDRANEILTSLRVELEVEDRTTVSNQQAKINHDKRLEALRKDIQDIKRQIAGLEAYQCPILAISCDLLRVKNASPLNDLHDTLTQKTQEINQLLSIEIQVQDHSHAQQIKERIAKGDRHVQGLQGDLSVSRFQIDRLEVDRLEVDQARRLVETISREIAVCEEKITDLQHLAYACSEKGVPLYILINELKGVERVCNSVLETLEVSQRVRFSPFLDLQSYEKTCPVCESSVWKGGRCGGCGTERPKKRKYQPVIEVLDGKDVRAFDLTSDGEKVLISFAVRLACASLVSNMTGIRSEFVVLDETFAMLDATNRQRILNLCVEKLPQFGIKQVFVVSHHADVVANIPKVLRVEKVGGLSRVVEI